MAAALKHDYYDTLSVARGASEDDPKVYRSSRVNITRTLIRVIKPPRTASRTSRKPMTS